ncbi:MAG: MmgE/PrpD family protein, partial [Desulfomonilia bacterium]|nr:MmgE/PrpD family protein [Desulfomonilia bacterium]
MTEKTPGFTARIAAFIVGTDASSIPSWAYDHARVAFMDWLGVTFAGKDDPLVHKLIDYADLMGGREQATIIGHGMKKDVGSAALINGSASHALDYDDTLVSFLGHPSVTLFPSLLALSEWKNFGGSDLLTAYLIGLQAGGTIGACASLDHYMAGWHATSTLGYLASAAGCARLLGLDEQQTRYALGIAGTQSSGLKRVFGTMCKPFHAGRSSQAGLMSALLAGQGFTSAEDILEGPQGFFEALKGKVNEDIVGLLGLGWDVVNLSQKYHASCHATHSPMEATLALVQEHDSAISRIRSITVQSSRLALDAAGKDKPRTGLEGKFSIPYCVANALLRGETGMQAFTDEKVSDPEVQGLMKKIHAIHDPEMKALEATVEIETTDGETYQGFSDILQQIPPLEIKR